MKKILVVEDDKDLATVLATMLSLEGFEVDCAYDGETALKKVAEFMPALIILDIMIPKINGILLTEKLKENPITKNIPIIIVTAKIDIEEFFMVDNQLTVAACFIKPVLGATLVSKIKELLNV